MAYVFNQYHLISAPVVDRDDRVIGFEDGFKGLLEGRYRELDINAVSGVLARGGTILGSSRLERNRLAEACDNAEAFRHKLSLDALIPIGGEGTLTAARMLADAGIPVVGVPLPLVSYGGTALISLFIGLGILMSVQAHRKLVTS